MNENRKRMVPDLKPIVHEVLDVAERTELCQKLKDGHMSKADVLNYVSDAILKRSPKMVVWNEKSVWTCRYCGHDNEVEHGCVQVWCRKCRKARKFHTVTDGRMRVTVEREEPG